MNLEKKLQKYQQLRLGIERKKLKFCTTATKPPNKAHNQTYKSEEKMSDILAVQTV